MSVIALLKYEESALRICQKYSTVSIISEQPSYVIFREMDIILRYLYLKYFIF